ncbi:hypothetical protein BHU72_02495 [Desulfuribacillus stibiiarsenatis]|uniref:RNA polymerase subunit sigma n=1 Tax=Desulfuribacillus stibiiarsenatis TaxID=1390249 RepID=A0A1E5L6S2_9FIRM|nr:RNA polymerase sigma factor [Desulfuribacillus stibiiarsenatis]OEH85683.1 hypothetical protein BHU72_02495 [Desulfuribacillus stibiiarsenatis]
MISEEIVNLAKQGDREALVVILKNSENAIYQTAYYLTKNEADAKDLTQDTLLRVYQKFHTYQGQASIKVWVQRITTNIFLDKVRKKKAQLFSLDNEAYQYIPDEGYSVEEQVEGQMKSQEVREAVQKLPEQYKLVVVLRYLQDMTYKEIADILEIPENTVKTHLFRARKHLKELLRTSMCGGVS